MYVLYISTCHLLIIMYYANLQNLCKHTIKDHYVNYSLFVFDSDVVIALSLMFCMGTCVIFLIICYCQRLKSQALKQLHISQKQSSPTTTMTHVINNKNINGNINGNESDNECTIIKLKHGSSNDDMSRSNEMKTSHLSLNHIISNSVSHSNGHTLTIPVTKLGRSKSNIYSTSPNKSQQPIPIPMNPINQIQQIPSSHLPPLISSTDHQHHQFMTNNSYDQQFIHHTHSKTHHLDLQRSSSNSQHQQNYSHHHIYYPQPRLIQSNSNNNVIIPYKSRHHASSFSYSPIDSVSNTNKFPSPIALQPRRSAGSNTVSYHHPIVHTLPYNHVHRSPDNWNQMQTHGLQPQLVQNRQQQIQRAQIPQYNYNNNNNISQYPTKLTRTQSTADTDLTSVTTTPPPFNPIILQIENHKSKSSSISSQGATDANSASSASSSSSESDCLSTKSDSKSKTSREYSFADDDDNDDDDNDDNDNKKNSNNNYKCAVLKSPRDASFDTNQTIITSIKSPSTHNHELSGAVNSVLGDIIGVVKNNDNDDDDNDNDNKNESDADDDIEPSTADTSNDTIYPFTQYGSSQLSLSETPQPESYRGYIINTSNRYTNVIANIRTQKKPYKY